MQTHLATSLALGLGLGLAATPALADIHPFPSSRPLVAAQLGKGEAGVGAAWSGIARGGSNQFALTGSYGGFESLDLALSLIPTGDASLVAGGELLYTPWQSGRWSAGLDLGGYLPLGEIETYHFDHGEVRHSVSSARLGVDVRWRGLYFGTGYLHAWDRRDYVPGTAPSDSRAPEFAREHSDFNLGGSQQHLGLVLGNAVQFRIEAVLMDEAFYNLLIEPSDPIHSASLTLSAGITYFPGRFDRKPDGAAGPEPKAVPRMGMPPDTASRKPLFDLKQYQRGILYGTAASLVGAVAGAALGTAQDDEDYAILPPEVMLALAGAVVTVPIGSAYGVLSDPRFERKARPVAWGLAGTAAGFAAGALLAPVTAGLSFWFLTPLGSAMGFRHGSG